jgi:hypothetical protein
VPVPAPWGVAEGIGSVARVQRQESPAHVDVGVARRRGARPRRSRPCGRCARPRSSRSRAPGRPLASFAGRPPRQPRRAQPEGTVARWASSGRTTGHRAVAARRQQQAAKARPRLALAEVFPGAGPRVLAVEQVGRSFSALRQWWKPSPRAPPGPRRGAARSRRVPVARGPRAQQSAAPFGSPASGSWHQTGASSPRRSSRARTASLPANFCRRPTATISTSPAVSTRKPALSSPRVPGRQPDRVGQGMAGDGRQSANRAGNTGSEGWSRTHGRLLGWVRVATTAPARLHSPPDWLSMGEGSTDGDDDAATLHHVTFLMALPPLQRRRRRGAPAPLVLVIRPGLARGAAGRRSRLVWNSCPGRLPHAYDPRPAS